ncbi:MAG: hypothetical protein M0036_10980 [Desulfobacteraceae bacterium]|nr:hypothetical protein [Desulfobacteraceae bacterium]
MSDCRHTQLVLLPMNQPRLRCRRCHLTLRAEELQGGYCPECFQAKGERHYDFETVATNEEVKYRCEQCGAIIEYRPASPTM